MGVRTRWILGSGLLIVLVAGGGVFVRLARTRPPRGVRHVILISLDTTRADHLGCYGNTWIQTPNLDALARESILFTNYMTVASTTLASHTSLFTGKYPHNHGVPRNGFMVNAANVMLPEILKDAGFTTAGFLGSFALDRRFDFSQGFDFFDQDFDILVGEGGANQNQRTADAVSNTVIDYLDRRTDTRNLFLFAHYFDPHAPYAPPAPYDTMYGDGDGSVAVPVEEHPVLGMAQRPDDVQDKILRYAGEVSYMDAALGRLLDDLRKRGVLDDAILIVASDHGENLTDIPGRPFDHGWTVYEPEVRAVCMIRLPGANGSGRTYDDLVASIDVLPTLASYLGLPIPAGADGRALDLRRLGSASEPWVRFAEATKPWERAETDPRWYNRRKPRCARRGDLKYIRTEYRGTEEFYDLFDDPREHRNLLPQPVAQYKAAVDELERALSSWADAAEPLPTRFEPSQRMETIRRLRSLGYLSSEPDEDASGN